MCGGKLLPKYSELEVCLVESNAYSIANHTECSGLSSVAGSGYNFYTGQEHREPLSCTHTNIQSALREWLM